MTEWVLVLMLSTGIHFFPVADEAECKVAAAIARNRANRLGVEISWGCAQLTKEE